LLQKLTRNIQIYKNNTKLLFKNHVKLTLQCRSKCSDVFVTHTPMYLIHSMWGGKVCYKCEIFGAVTQRYLR